MTYSDCDPDRPTTPESRLRDALEADVARHLAKVRAGFEADRAAMAAPAVTWNPANADLYMSLLRQGQAASGHHICAQQAMNNQPYNQYFDGSLQAGNLNSFGNPWRW